MNDLISRQDAVESIRECAEAAHNMNDWDMEQGYLNAIECIEEEPSAYHEIIHCKDCRWRNAYERGKAEAQQRWIPVSEMLPEENMWTICQNNAGAMMIGKYDIEFGWMFPAYFDGVVAWMPLPEPYQEEGEK